MSIADTHFQEAVKSLSRRIVEAEMRSKAAVDALTAMTRDEADTADVERRFIEEMDALLALRQQLWELRSPEGEQPFPFQDRLEADC